MSSFEEALKRRKKLLEGEEQGSAEESPLPEYDDSEKPSDYTEKLKQARFGRLKKALGLE